MLLARSEMLPSVGGDFSLQAFSWVLAWKEISLRGWQKAACSLGTGLFVLDVASFGLVSVKGTRTFVLCGRGSEIGLLRLGRLLPLS